MQRQLFENWEESYVFTTWPVGAALVFLVAGMTSFVEILS
jgi:hypothetical protein